MKRHIAMAMLLGLVAGLALGQTSSMDTNGDGAISALEYASATVEPIMDEYRGLAQAQTDALQSQTESINAQTTAIQSQSEAMAEVAAQLQRIADAQDEPRRVIIQMGVVQDSRSDP